jgi:protoporphyrinogen oxidase
VTVYEAGPQAGGVSAACELGGFTVDRFYHTILPGDTELLGLLAELGLADRVAWRVTRTGFARAGRRHSVSNVGEFLRFPVLTPAERLRLGWTLWRAQHGVSWRDVAPLTCEQWLTSACGRGTFEKLWRPLLRAKLGEAAPRVSASFIWATMNRLQDAKRGAGAGRQDRMGFLRGSYRVLLDALADDLARAGVRLVTGAAVSGLAPAAGGGWRLETAAGVATHRRVVATLPPAVVADVTAPGALDGAAGAGGDGGASGGGGDAESRRRLRAVEYLGVEVAVLLLSRPLGPFYVLNLGDPDLPLTGVIETTNLAPPGYFGGQSLVYLPRYVAPGGTVAAGAADGPGAATAAFEAGLARVYPEFHPGLVEDRLLQRAPHVQPIHTVDYAGRLPPPRLAPGLWLASSAQIHPWPLNNDRVLRQARRVADAFLAEERP